MIPYWLWSWVLTAAGAMALYVIGSKRRWGWAVGLASQVLWIAYALATQQYGFLLSVLVYGYVYTHGWRAAGTTGG